MWMMSVVPVMMVLGPRPVKSSSKILPMFLMNLVVGTIVSPILWSAMAGDIST